MTARDRTRAALRAASDRLSSPPVRMFLEFVGMVTGSVLVAAAPNPPTTTPQVAQMVGGAVLGGAAGLGVRVVVVTLGEIRCAGGGLPTIVGTTGGDCVDTDTTTVGDRVPEIVDELRGGG